MVYKETPEKSDTLKEFYRKIQPYQNIIFFVLLIIFLAVLLLVWRGYRVNKLSAKAWEELRNVPMSSENMRVLSHQYRLSSALPVIQFRLANALALEGKLQEAKKEYDSFIKNYPDHPFRDDAQKALKTINNNIDWESKEQEHKDKLRTMRNYPCVIIKTSKGDFEIELYEDEAPNTVANFITLAQNGFYSQTPFDEIQDTLGLCLGTKGITPTYTIPFEENSLQNKEGTIGMIRTLDPDAKENIPEKQDFLDSANTRFYISLKANPFIDGKYTVFGRVIKGMDIVTQITKGIKIEEINVTKKRNHTYTPARIEK